MHTRLIWIIIIFSVLAIGCQSAQTQEKPSLKHPCLEADASEIEQAKGWLKKYDWYNDIYLKEKEKADKFISGQESIYVSPIKQEWSYDGYVCPKDKTPLQFDETKPFEHKCPKCGEIYKGHKYDADWSTQYNNSLGWRTHWLGIVYQITGEEKYAKAAREILVQFAELYLKFSDQNNILGPARVFNSTLGEALWGVEMAKGYDFVYNSPCFSAEDHKIIKEKFFYPLAEIVQKFPESVSNRQLAYNNAVAAVGFLYNDRRLIDIAFDGKYGYKYQLRVGMPRDGFWYEGSGYHYFALLLFCHFAEMARHNGIDYYNMKIAGHSLKQMFDAPFNAIGPDYEFPGVRDIGGATLFQRPQWYEAGYVRYKDPRYAQLINYAAKVNKRPRSSIFFFVYDMDLPKIEGELYPETSYNFEETGLALLRDKVSDDRKFVYFDYGIVGGEHGHPDRLAIGYYAKGKNWLVDPRNENYAFANLQTWYRQTIAHNTMVVNETKQAWGNGYCRFFGETPGLKVVSGSNDKIYNGVKMTRTILLIGDYFIDLFDAQAPETRTYDLPYHSFGTLSIKGTELEKQPLDIFGHKPGIQGYDQLTEVKKGETDNDLAAIFQRDDGTGLSILTLGAMGSSVYSAMTPGVGGAYDAKLPMVMVRRNAESMRFESVIEAFKDKPSVTGFRRKAGSDTYIVTIGDEVHTIKADVKGKTFSVIKMKAGKLIQISVLNSKEIADEAGKVLFKADFTLESVDIRYEEDQVIVKADTDFGKINIYSPEISHIVINGKHIKFERIKGDDYCQLKQNGITAIKLIAPPNNKIFLDGGNMIGFQLFNYGENELSVEAGLKLADGWQEKIQSQLDYWGGIVNLVATNKSDIKKVIFPAIPKEFSADWIDKVRTEKRAIKPGESEVFPFWFNPESDKVAQGNYEIVLKWKQEDDKDYEKKSFSFEVLEPVTADLILPNGKSNELIVVLKNNTSCELAVNLGFGGSKYWYIEGEAQVKLLPYETVEHKVTAKLVDYNPEGQLYPIELTTSWGDFKSVICKDFYIAICHFSDNPPSLDGSFKGWNTSTPLTIDKQNQVSRLLVGNQSWEGVNDLSAKAYMMYDKDYLYVGCEVTDNKVVEHYDYRMRWPFDPDSVEVILDTRINSEQGADPLTKGTFRHLALPEYRAVKFDASMPGDISVWFRQISGAETFFKKTEKGYNMIVRIPLSSLPLVNTKDGAKVGFDLAISDNDGAFYRKNEHIWAGYNQNQSWLNYRLIGALIFRGK